MNEQQFELLMEKLEIIRCGIIDVETEAQGIKELAQQHLTGDKSEPADICPKCGWEYPRRYKDGSWKCTECGHKW
jgi:hypothetical protein